MKIPLSRQTVQIEIDPESGAELVPYPRFSLASTLSPVHCPALCRIRQRPAFIIFAVLPYTTKIHKIVYRYDDAGGIIYYPSSSYIYIGDERERDATRKKVMRASSARYNSPLGGPIISYIVV